MVSLSDFIGFDWDGSNKDKNWKKYKVSHTECEEVFFNVPIMVVSDKKHSKTEKRYYVLGRTGSNRFLFVVFTPRGDKIRIISARDMNKKKGGFIMSAKKKIPKFKTEEEERAFWATHDSTEYIDYKKSQKVLFPNLKPSVKTISIRLPEGLLDSLKVIAHRNDIPYQTLMKIMLSQSVEKQMSSRKK